MTNELALAMVRARERALNFVSTLRDVPPLLVRLTLGSVFITSGWGKVNDLEKVTEFFTELGIVAPHFNAVLVSFTELLGGALVLVGLFTRIAALPLANTMIVAIITAQLSEVEAITDILGLSEFAYLVMFIGLAIHGPGRLALDHLVFRPLRRESIDSCHVNSSQPLTST